MSGLSHWWKFFAVLGIVALLVSGAVPLRAQLGDYALSQTPLYAAQSQPPLMMMVMSRDEQLFNKAYSDYSALDTPGVLDTTYKDTFTYEGYFEPGLCYKYESSQFKASSVATGANKHSCDKKWSGNFLNWVTMSRLDILRYVLYGGQRKTDDPGKTVIERASIPNDLHAWVKVYTGTDINQFTPLSSASSFCNATIQAGGDPLMRVVSGSYSEWAATALKQCAMNNGDNTPTNGQTDFIVRVEVCDPKADETLREKFCRKYSDSTADHYKPAGLLQSYGESGRLRFGLISGTYGKPRDGGVLRRNIGKLAGNGIGDCKAGDEIRMSTGQFCLATDSGSEGIINTISNFRLTEWNYADKWKDCNDYGILNRTSGKHLDDPGDSGNGSFKCSGWGNPVAEMYAEALRYVGNIGNTRTGYYSATGDLSGLPGNVKWLDPYRAPADGGNSYCATCNILVMSSGLPSFDSDDIATVPELETADSATNKVGAAEGINGGRWMAGRVSATPKGDYTLNTHEDICQGLTVSGLSVVRGLCPDAPSTEGSYLLSGLAYAAARTDMRPGLQGKDDAKDKVPVTTYTVAMAENLPKFEVPVGGGKITLAPLCQANNNGDAKISDSGWRSCFLGSVGIGIKTSTASNRYVYGRPLKSDGSAGSFSLVWEDSLWGNDHDNDVVAMMSYCVGNACSETGAFRDICWRAQASAICNGSQTLSATIGADEVLVRVETLSAYAGNAMLTGFTIVGSDAANNVQRLVLRSGGNNPDNSSRDGSILTSTNNAPGGWDPPRVLKFKLSTDQANQLESPLWYAAKYGVPEDKNWDANNDGQPDNYFLARNPAKLREALGAIFEGAAGDNKPVSGGGSGARISTGSFTLAASYDVPTNSNDWTGDLVARRVTSTGEDGAELWRASTKVTSAGRKIYMATAPTGVDADGAVVPAKGAEFTAANIPGIDRTAKLARMGLENVPTWFGGPTVTVDTLVSYLHGNNVSGWRARGSVIGDIVNSSPEVVSPKDDYGYGSWAGFTTVPWKKTIGAAYKTFLTTKQGAGGAPSMAYVGANDGFLHAFNATDSAAGGTEVFAFMPSAALGHIAELANPAYVHRYYVDGLMTAGDVYYDDNWHTVLVGSTGAGGASQAPSTTRVGHGSVFGLDISDPTHFDQDSVLWEVSGENDSDMGFALGKPVIVPIAGASGPRFVAMFGNGVNSSNGQPTLFVVDIQTGEVLSRLKPTGHNSRNGLMNIAPIALKNFDRVVDTVYGGDMEGNLWKFDLSNPDPTKWNVAYNGAPLFTATRDGAAQPITGGLEVSSGPGGGVSIFFGTGRYFADGDNLGGTTLPVQSIYGIWDNMAGTVGGRGDLVGQTITSTPDSNGYETRAVSNNAVNYTVKRGWYVDLVVDGVGTGERFIGNPNIQNGRVFFTTYITGEASCGPGGGTNWLYGLDLLTGAGAMSGVTTSIGGTSVCSGNCGAVALGKGGTSTNSPPTKDTNIFVPKLTPCDPADPACTVDKLIGAEQCTFVLRAVGADPLYLPRPCGRQSWRQVR